MKKESKSYQAILKSAKDLFWKYGISRVSVEEICKEAGVSKMTFYRMFSNKIEIAFVVMENFFAENRLIYRSIMDQEGPFSEKAKEIILLKQKASSGMSKEFLKDIYQSEDESLKNRMDLYRQESANEVMQDWKNAQEKGWIRKDLKLDFMLYMMNQMSVMINDEYLNALYSNAESLINELNHFFFYGILSNGNSEK